MTDERPMYRRLFWRCVRLGLVAVLLIALLPFGLTVLYRYVDPPGSTLMMARVLTGEPVTHDWVPLEQMSPRLIASVIVSEDSRYCSHGGIDWQAIELVLEQAEEGKPLRGASTITMQTVKNLFLWHGRSYLRKALEVPLALWANQVLSKRRLLEIYLNIAEWGPGIFGAEAAARYRFKRSAAKLGREQSALLATSLPNPALRNPARPGRKHKRLGRIIQKRAAQSGGLLDCL
ncbi:monofunctional biosynthetic peptidoglycan transglycosylase [Coralliovum pocilloporae]|uniref:monofunctional biosynthetic peptidoglycan transglycosylase n=1 Tax=Coralliovum pocilloporae TaxID=3066369 RepID=UPI003307428F